MHKNTKNALIFTGGVVVGITLCGAKVVKIALNDEDVLEAIKKKIVRKVEKLLYGEQPVRRNRSKVSYRSYYDDLYTNYSSPYVYEQFVYADRETASKVLENMKDIIREFGFVTVADYCDLSEKSCDQTDHKYGWVTLRQAEVVNNPDLGGYTINFRSKPCLLK